MAMVVNNASFLWKRFYVKLQFYRCGRLVEPYVGIILDYTTELCQYPKLNILNCSTTLLYLYFVQLLITFLSIKTVRIVPSYTTTTPYTLNCYLVTYRYIPYTIYFHPKITKHHDRSSPFQESVPSSHYLTHLKYYYFSNPIDSFRSHATRFSWPVI